MVDISRTCVKLFLHIAVIAEAICDIFRLIWENVEESDVNITELVDLFCKLNVTKKKPLSSTLGKATKKVIRINLAGKFCIGD